jgi:hypothetical protein
MKILGVTGAVMIVTPPGSFWLFSSQPPTTAGQQPNSIQQSPTANSPGVPVDTSKLTASADRTIQSRQFSWRDKALKNYSTEKP